MSSILEALRKVDEQKSARRLQPVDVTQGVLRGKSPSQGLRIKIWHIVLAGSAVAGCSILVTLLVSSQDKKLWSPLPSSKLSPRTLPEKPAQALSVAPAQVMTVPAVPLHHNPSLPTKTAVQTPRIADKLFAKPAGPAKVVSTPDVETPAQPSLVDREYSAAKEQIQTRVSVPTVRLTGIGWQKDAAARYAVINGTAIAEGGSVEGVKVEEILPDKVRIRVDGNLQEISLGK